MTGAVRSSAWREYGLGLLLGLYAALIAMTQGTVARAVLCTPLILLPLGWWMLQAPNRWLLVFFAAAWLLPPLPVAIGDSGPHIAILFAGAGLFIGMLLLGRWRIHIDSLTISLAGLFAMFLASIGMAALLSGDVIAVSSLARVLLFGICVYVFFYVRGGPAATSASHSLQLVRVLFCLGIATALFACIDFYFQFPAPAGYGPQFIWLETGVFRRAQGLFYEASTLGNLCAFFLEMAVIALFARSAARPLPALVLISGGAVFATALVLSYSRASLVNVAVALAVFLWLRRDRIRFTRLLTIAIIFAGAGSTLVFAFAPAFSRAYWLRLTTSIQFFFTAPDRVLSGRVESWTILRDFLLQQPWHAFLGIGYKTLPYSGFLGTGTVADNTYLSTLVETGVLGLAALLLLLAAILRQSYRAARSSDLHRAFLGTWSLCFWSGQVVQFFSGDLLTYWRVLPAYLCILALAIREPFRDP